ncbi:hypothetical protein [Paenibacillus sp. NPDC057934]|uniref:hypothetical protein n=1 Tax=Paenibacillus sp. NPDC057934 TaxID=3346282 RepID=UPI0036DC13FD
MSLKPVELQIAVPRTTEAGRIQNELQHRPAADQQQLAAQNVKQSQEMTQRTAEVDDPSETALRDDGGRGNNPGGHSSQEKGHNSDGSLGAKHPYKGLRIDLSL